MSNPKNDLPEVLFASDSEWEGWLEKNYSESPGIWMQIAKKGSGLSSVTYDEAVETALCFGWIDGQKQKKNEKLYLQRFTPRRVRSVWSKVNVGKVEELARSGRMRDAGLEQVKAAKADGRWDAAYHPASTATVPKDLQAALDVSPKAKEFFETLSKSNRYAILYRVQDAKRPETRARRIEKFISMLENRETLHG